MRKCNYNSNEVAYREVLTPWINQNTLQPNPDPNRNIRISIWFPVDKKQVENVPLMRYRIDPCLSCNDTFRNPSTNDFFGTPFAGQMQILGNAYYNSSIVYDGSYLTPNGKYPVIVLSHGLFVVPFFTDFLSSICKYGFIIVAPMHSGNSAKDAFYDTGITSNNLARRAQQIHETVVPWIFQNNSTSQSPFYNKMDIDNMGLYGFSSGAETVIFYQQNYSQFNYFKALFAGESFLPNVNLNVKINIPSFLETSSFALLTNGASTNNSRDLTTLYRIFLNVFNGEKMAIEVQGANHTTNIADLINPLYLSPLLLSLNNAGYTVFVPPTVTPGSTSVVATVVNSFITSFTSQSIVDPTRPITPEEERIIFRYYIISWFGFYLLACDRCDELKYKKMLGLVCAAEKQLKVNLVYPADFANY